MTKRKYLTISEGYSAQDAQPIIATSDERVIRAAARELSKCLITEPGKSKSDTDGAEKL
jgi:hypothetical protein